MEHHLLNDDDKKWVNHHSQRRAGFGVFPAKLHVVTVVSNPIRFYSRYKLYHAFEKQITDASAELYTVEIAFGDRPFEITQADNPKHLQLRTNSEVWHKENALNLMMQRLPSDWEYVAWIDADILFTRPDWAQETLHLLQHFDIIQMFSHAQDMGPKFEPLLQFRSFMHSYLEGIPYSSPYDYYTGLDWHPGYAWAARRSALNHLGGLIDRAILGSADRHMAAALIGKVDSSYHPQVSPQYKKMLRIWQDRANKYIKKNIGYMDGLILHYWHGKKVDRGYSSRWKILYEDNYNPELDLKRDTNGLFQITDRNIKLRDDIRGYFRSRNEDSIDK
jgi:hypothetical protein